VPTRTSLRESRLTTVDADAAQDDVVPGDSVPDLTGDSVDRPLEALVLPRLHLAAVVTDDVVMMIAPRERRLVPSSVVTDVQALDKAEVGEEIEHAVDARDSNRPSGTPSPLVDLLRRRTAALPAQQFDDGRTGSAATEPALVEDGEGVLGPGHDGY
jgi:hypothetical protein